MWRGFEPRHSRVFVSLSKSYDVVIDPQDPEILVFSCFGMDHLDFDCVKLFVTGENIVPDFNLCDYAIGYHHLTFEDRYLRTSATSADDLFNDAAAVRNEVATTDLTARRFCNFIYSNGAADPVRDKLFHLLNDKKPVASLGHYLKNSDDVNLNRPGVDWGTSKIAVQRGFNFTIAFENSETSGYTTEKIAHAFMAGTIPIYWGDPRIAEDFNPRAFIHLRDFETPQDCANFVITLSEDAERMAAYLSEPVFRDNRVPDHLSDAHFDSFLNTIVSQPPAARPRRAPHGGRGNTYIRQRQAEQRILRKHAKFKRILRRFSPDRVVQFYARFFRR
ncbi:glycosyltransferase family 10 domain-containing protein [Yoonia algicola]|uniref:Glycosyltransferase family 10 n=1 Tax=Yoonia algicola TaxID=3137368 RepID=A0AAN0M4M7_9RHOB